MKGLRIVKCSEEHTHMPFLASSDMSKEQTDRMFATIEKNVNSKNILKYFPLAKYLKTKMLKVNVDDYKTTLDMYQKALDQGWVDEYGKWIESQKPERK